MGEGGLFICLPIWTILWFLETFRNFPTVPTVEVVSTWSNPCALANGPTYFKMYLILWINFFFFSFQLAAGGALNSYIWSTCIMDITKTQHTLIHPFSFSLSNLKVHTGVHACVICGVCVCMCLNAGTCGLWSVWKSKDNLGYVFSIVYLVWDRVSPTICARPEILSS